VPFGARSALECGSSSYRLPSRANPPAAEGDKRRRRRRLMAENCPAAAALRLQGHLTARYEDQKAVAAATALQGASRLLVVGLRHRLFAPSNVQHHPVARSSTPPHLRRGVPWLIAPLLIQEGWRAERRGGYSVPSPLSLSRCSLQPPGGSTMGVHVRAAGVRPRSGRAFWCAQRLGVR
jgi:hypothetical protein